MTTTDSIAVLFTLVRNAVCAGHRSVKVQLTNMNMEIIKILSDEGFIGGYELESDDLKKKKIKVRLKYDSDGKALIQKINRISKPGKRVYVSKRDIPKVLGGFGVSLLTTPKGILTGKAARLANVGGELIGEVY